MRELIRSMRQQATVILSTHIMQEVNAVCDRVLMIRHGELALDSTLAELQQSNRVLLTTSLAPDALRQALEGAAPVQSIQPLETDTERPRYRSEIQSDSKLHEACAHLAQRVIQAGGQLYALTPEIRDLETLFREINQAPREVAHAA